MQVFISYAREDGQDLAQQLHKDLAARDINTWMDKEGMAVGQGWDRQIENAIRHSTYLLLVVTPGALRSEIVQDEIAFASQHRATIMPLYYKSVEEFPLRLLRLHYIDFRQDKLYDKSFQMLYDHLQQQNITNLPVIPLSVTPYYRTYLQSLIGHLRDLPIERINPNASYSITMDKLWTPLDVDYRESGEANNIRIPVLEAISTHHQLLILGDPGSGKSSVLHYIAICLASATLQNPNLSQLDLSNVGPTWRRGLLCPIYLELLEFAEQGLQIQRQNQLLEYIVERAEASSKGFGKELRQKIFNGDCVILLDGLDEVPSSNRRRQSVQDAVLSFSKDHTNCPIVITSRTYAYHQSPWRLSTFQEVIIAPFTADQIDAFLYNWYSSLPPRFEMQKQQKDRLKQEIHKDPEGLGELAQRPLLLTFLASMYTFYAETLPKSKSDLYEQIIQLMLREWENTRTIVDRETGRAIRVSSSLTEFLGLPQNYGLLHEVLQEIAYNAHLQQKNTEEPSGISVGEIAHGLHMLARQHKQSDFDINPFLIEEDINARAGLLQPHGHSSYRFPHRTIQEFLAACHICRKEYYPYALQKVLYEEPEHWREVLMFMSDIIAVRQGTACLLPLLDALLTRPESIASHGESEREYLVAHYAGLIIIKQSLLSYKTKLWSITIEETRQRLKSLVNQQVTTPIIRAHVGRTLAILGDDRPGVGLREGGLPDIDWCHIPAGEFPFGEEKGGSVYRLYLPDFWISRYPVTNIQFQAFVEDQGYTEKWRECWTEAGWEWDHRPGRQRIMLDAPFSLPNHPRVGVDFFEAYAYSRWISKKLNIDIRLPDEPEWEKAARGSKGLRYPWGNRFDPNAANILTAQINSTCAVGLFPPSPYGVYDLVGNISEWCITLWDPQYGYLLENMDNDPDGEYQRIVRGSAYTYNPEKATATYRHWEDPQDRKLIQGFRLVTTTNPME